MKKFLTVLLALSVVFTYSFSAVGTVFAAVSPSEAANTAIAKEQKAMTEHVDAFAGSIIYDQQGNVRVITGVDDANLDKNLTKGVIEAALAKLKSDYNTLISTAAAEAVKDNEWTDADDTAVADAWKTTLENKVANVLFAADGYAAKDGVLYTEAVKAAKATAQAAMEAIDPANYNDTDAATIVAKKADLTTAVTGAENSKTGLETLLAAVTTFKAATKDLVTKADAAAALEKAKKEAIDTVNDAAADFTAAERARLQAIIAEPEAITDATDVAQASARLGSVAANVQKTVALYVGKQKILPQLLQLRMQHLLH